MVNRSARAGRRAGSFSAALLCLLSMTSVVVSVAAQTQLGTIGKESVQFTVSYEGSVQPGGYITFINTLTYYGPGTWGNDRVSEIQFFTDFGNYTVPGTYPAYFTENNTVRTLTIPIPASIPQGNHQVVAIARLQFHSINIYNPDLWYNETGLAIKGTVPIQTPLGAALSGIATTITKYWPPIFMTYLTAAVFSIFLVAEQERKKQSSLRVPFASHA